MIGQKKPYRLELFVDKVVRASIPPHSRLLLSIDFWRLQRTFLQSSRSSADTVEFGAARAFTFDLDPNDIDSVLGSRLSLSLLDGTPESHSLLGKAEIQVQVVSQQDAQRIPINARASVQRLSRSDGSFLGDIFTETRMFAVEALTVPNTEVNFLKGSVAPKKYVVKVTTGDNKPVSTKKVSSKLVDIAPKKSVLYVLQYDVEYQLKACITNLTATLKRDYSHLNELKANPDDMQMKKITSDVASTVRLLNIALEVVAQLRGDAVDKDLDGPPAHSKNALKVPKTDTVCYLLQYDVLYQLQGLTFVLSSAINNNRSKMEVPLKSLHKQHQKFFRRLVGTISSLARRINIVMQAAADGNIGKKIDGEDYSDDESSESAESSSDSDVSDVTEEVPKVPKRSNESPTRKRATISKAPTTVTPVRDSMSSPLQRSNSSVLRQPVPVRVEPVAVSSSFERKSGETGMMKLSSPSGAQPTVITQPTVVSHRVSSSMEHHPTAAASPPPPPPQQQSVPQQNSVNQSQQEVAGHTTQPTVVNQQPQQTVAAQPAQPAVTAQPPQQEVVGQTVQANQAPAAQPGNTAPSTTVQPL